nr:arylesterase [Thiohalomonas denitrificans]
MFIIRRVVILLLWVCGTIAASPCESDERPALLVLGDSLSAAYGLPMEKGWVHLLAQRLEQRGYSHRIVNASTSGETSRGGRERLPALLKRHEPQVVVIELGGNDGLRGLPLERLKSNLAMMIRQARESGARVLLVGIQMPPNYGPEYTRRFSAVYRELSEEMMVALVPFLLEGVAGDSTLMQPDGMHATAAAQPKLLNSVWKHLEPLLRETTENTESDSVNPALVTAAILGQAPSFVFVASESDPQ